MSKYIIYYSGAITVNAEDEEDARQIFERNYFEYGDIEEIVEES